MCELPGLQNYLRAETYQKYTLKGQEGEFLQVKCDFRPSNSTQLGNLSFSEHAIRIKAKVISEVESLLEREA